MFQARAVVEHRDRSKRVAQLALSATTAALARRRLRTQLVRVAVVVGAEQASRPVVQAVQARTVLPTALVAGLVVPHATAATAAKAATVRRAS